MKRRKKFERVCWAFLSNILGPVAHTMNNKRRNLDTELTIWIITGQNLSFDFTLG